MLEARRELERLLCRLGAQRASEEQRDALREIADGMDRAAKTNDDIIFMRLDRELNLLISDAAHNEYALGRHALPARPFAALLVLALQAGRRPALAPGCMPPGARHRRRRPEARSGCADRLIDYTETFTRATVGAGLPARPIVRARK